MAYAKVATNEIPALILESCVSVCMCVCVCVYAVFYAMGVPTCSTAHWGRRISIFKNNIKFEISFFKGICSLVKSIIFFGTVEILKIF